ncbi:retropepsin-like aspartic protease family protein [Chitinolyticbacter meiyuanensis]|uniref:retropepsin-like aspartic protease family protein n=1 Tax=Chitinolyticbacter meiyuanensis TaxID=682798 RepID=UPI0011E59DF6|nr:TIGR02281 family clan AA aspartic protease [Chitinolyticbacter meiyuanensis]
MMKALLMTAALFLAGTVQADQITLLATMGNKAVVDIDGKRHTVAIGQKAGVAKLVKLDGESAVFEVDSKQRRLLLGEGYVAGNSTVSQEGASVVLSPDAKGHYFAQLSINGNSVNGVVDTGATHLSMNVEQAKRLGIAYANGQPAQAQTANGTIKAWIIQLQQVKIGGITIYNTPATVREGGDDTPVLIGTSFLNRFQMKRDQELMILTKKAY